MGWGINNYHYCSCSWSLWTFLLLSQMEVEKWKIKVQQDLGHFQNGRSQRSVRVVERYPHDIPLVPHYLQLILFGILLSTAVLEFKIWRLNGGWKLLLISFLGKQNWRCGMNWSLGAKVCTKIWFKHFDNTLHSWSKMFLRIIYLG